jgi:feruloyl-CoA synthase
MPSASISSVPPAGPFPPVEFQAPAVAAQRRDDGTLLLQSPRALEAHPHSVLVWLQRWAATRPNQPMLAERDAQGRWRSVSYAQGLAAVRSIATALQRAGASQQRPLLVLSENSIDLALVTWGALYAGVPVAPISPAYSLAAGELGRLRAASKLVAPWLVFVQDGERFGRAIDAIGLPPGRTLSVSNTPPGGMRLADWLDTEPDPVLDAAHAALDPALPAKYMFTSGSTGIPKAVVITHAMLAASQQMTSQILVTAPHDPMVLVDWLPWHHVMGGNVVLHRLLRFGGTLYLDEGRPMPGRFEQTLANLREHSPSYYFNVPAGFALLVAEFERDAAFARHFFERLEFAYFAGASLSKDMHERFQQAALRAVGRRVVVGTAYGATEITAAVMMRAWGNSDTANLGLPLPGVELKLVPDPAMASRYELRVRGPNVFREYLHAPALSEGAFDDEGYYRLGDAVRLAESERPVAGLLFAGRFAEDFKLGNGTWVRTAVLRQQLLSACAPLLREAVMVGEGQEVVCSMAWADAAACRKLLGIDEAAGDAALARHPALLGELARRLAAANLGQKASSSRIERLLLLAEPPSMDAYELTDKGSVNQRAVTEHRAASVAELYAEAVPAHVVQTPLTNL